MEKRVAGIIRWLERCVKAYKDGAVESALMDAECARADMETLRGDLWKKLEGRRCVRRRLSSFKAAEAILGALGIMLITATPLALPLNEPAREDRAEGHFPLALEWVTADERELLNNIRRRPDDELAFLESPVSSMSDVRVEEPIAEPQIARPQTAPARVAEPVRRRAQEPQSVRSEQKGPDSSLTYDSILSLIETGERAMKNEPPAIKVESAKGATVDDK